MKETSHNMLGKMGSKAQHTANLAASPTKTRDNEAVNISKPGKVTKGNRKIETKVKTISKEGASIGDHSWQADSQTQEEFRRQNETEILSRTLKYEREIGRRPTLLDLLGRFSCEEFEAVWHDLMWLYPNIGKTEWSSTATIPDVKQMQVVA